MLEKLQRARERAGEMERARVVWADGVEFDLLGERVRLVLDPTRGVQHQAHQIGRAHV